VQDGLSLSSVWVEVVTQNTEPRRQAKHNFESSGETMMSAKHDKSKEFDVGDRFRPGDLSRDVEQLDRVTSQHVKL
jgi:hypothetical protein